MDNAFERARAAYGTGAYDDATLEFLFPQLKECEDERIRKFLVKHISEWIGCIEHDLKLSSKDVESEEELAMFKAGLAYLEKQKEVSKAIEAIVRIDKFIDEYLANAHDMKDSDPDKKYYLGWDAALGNMSGILQDVYSGEKKKEQKPAWSEEDEKIYNKALDAIYYKDLNDKYEVVDALEALCDLISRKRKVIPPYAHWKPSEEQMKALQNAVALAAGNKVLAELYEQLKRL